MRALISFTGIYGFKRVSAIRASSLEYLEVFFAIILGFLFFSETLTGKEVLWGVLIVGGAYLMTRYKDE